MKRGKKIFVLSLFLILSLGIISGVLAAEDSSSDTQNIGKTAIGKISEIFTKLMGNEQYDYISNVLSPEVLLFLLVFLIIYAIVSQISVLNSKRWISVTASAVIAILSAGFIDPAWIAPVLNQYEALGITISFLVPFALLFYFIKDIMPDNRLLQKAVFTIFFIIVCFNAVLNWNKIDSPFSKFLYGVIIAGSVIMAIAGHKVFDYIFKQKVEEAVDSARDIERLILANKRLDAETALARIGPQLPAAERNRLDRRIKNMAAKSGTNL